MEIWLVLRLLVALSLVLVLPGFAITSAFFPRQSLGFAERLLFSVGLSLAVTAIGGLALNATTWGLQAGSWLILLGGITLGFGAVAAVRGFGQGYLRMAKAPLRRGRSPRDFLLLGMALLVATSAVVLARTPVPPVGLQGYTSLWILPDVDGSPDGVRIGISNQEFSTTRYNLKIEADGTTLREWRGIVLEPGKEWETRVVLSQPRAGPHAVRALLYRSDAPGEVYRSGVLWRDGSGR